MTTWIDRRAIPPSAEWIKEIVAGIESTDAFVAVITPAWAASEICGLELQHAVAHGKRLVGVLRQPTDDLPQALQERNWVLCTPANSFETALDEVVHALTIDLERVKNHTRLLRAAVDWDTAGRPRSSLLHRSEVSRAQRFLAAGDREEPRPTRLQRQFVEASAIGARRQRRLLMVGIGAFVSLVVGVTVLLVLIRAADRAADRLASSRRLAAAAIANLDVDPVRALRQALAAHRARATPEAQDALRQASAANRLLSTYVMRGPTTVAFSGNGRWVATGSVSGGIVIWRIGSPGSALRLRTPWARERPIEDLAFSGDGRSLTALASGGAVGTWDLEHPARVGTAGSLDDGYRTALSPTARRWLSAEPTGRRGDRVWIHSLTRRRPVPLRITRRSLESFALSDDGKDLLAGDDAGVVRRWKPARSPTLRTVYRHSDRSAATAVAIAPGGRTAAAGFADGRIALLRGGRLPIALRVHGAAIRSIAFSPDGHNVVSASTDRTVRVSDARHGRSLAVLRGHLAPVSDAVFSPDGARIASVGDDDRLRIWDWRLVAVTVLGRAGDPRTDALNDAAFSPDGRRVVAVGRRGSARIWTLDGSHAGSVGLRDQPGTAFAAAWRPDGRMVATGGADARYHGTSRVRPFYGKVRIWDPDSGKPMRMWDSLTGGFSAYPADLEAVFSMAFSPDGRLLAVGGAGRWTKLLKVENPNTRGRIPPDVELYCRSARPHKDGVRAVAFSPDGRQFASASNGDGTFTVEPVMCTTSEPALRLGSREDPSLAALAWAPDGRHVAVAGRAGIIRIWNVSTKQSVSLRAGSFEVTGLDYSPDGRVVASTGTDGTVRVWTIDGGRSPLVIPAQSAGAEQVQFSPDGRRLLTAGADGTVWIYTCIPCGPMRDLHSHATAQVRADIPRSPPIAQPARDQAPPPLTQPDFPSALRIERCDTYSAPHANAKEPYVLCIVAEPPGWITVKEYPSASALDNDLELVAVFGTCLSGVVRGQMLIPGGRSMCVVDHKGNPGFVWTDDDALRLTELSFDPTPRRAELKRLWAALGLGRR